MYHNELGVQQVKEQIINIFSNYHGKVFISVFFIFFDWLFGSKGDLLLVILLLTIFDTLTGAWKAAKLGELSSRGFFRFSTKLLVYFLLMATSALVDKALPITVAMPIMSGFLSVTEGLSVLENIAVLGFPVPSLLLKTLKDYNKKIAKNDSSNDQGG